MVTFRAHLFGPSNVKGNYGRFIRQSFQGVLRQEGDANPYGLVSYNYCRCWVFTLFPLSLAAIISLAHAWSLPLPGVCTCMWSFSFALLGLLSIHPFLCPTQHPFPPLRFSPPPHSRFSRVFVWFLVWFNAAGFFLQLALMPPVKQQSFTNWSWARL